MADNALAPKSKNKLPWYEQALPMAGRATFLPFQDTMPGSVMNQRSFALPGIIAGAANAITAPGRAYSGSDPMFDPQEEAANFAMNMMGGGMGASRAAPAPAGSLGMNVWHGSPHRFPPTAKNPLGEFDPMKIGTGEGAQAYGAGAGYLAEAKGTATGYRDTLAHKGALDLEYEAGKRGIPLNREAQVEFMRQSIPNVSPEKAARNFQNANIEARNLDQNKLAALFKDYKESKQGNLYKVDLPDEQIAKMLDWDKPLSQQSWYRPVADVVKEYKGAGKDVDAYAKLISKANARGGEVTGGQLYEGMLSQFGGDQTKVSAFMREAGIPGIRYLDQGSRPNTNSIAGIQANLDKAIARLKDWQGNTSSLGESQRKMFSEQVASFRKILQDAQNNPATSNFVVFDPKHMNIIGRE